MKMGEIDMAQRMNLADYRKALGLQLRKRIHQALVDILERRGIALDGLHFDGLIKVRELPFDCHDEIARWWLPEIVDGRLIRAARMSEREKERYTACEAHNHLTVSGRTALLAYLSSRELTNPPWSQQFGVGNFPIASVDTADTSVQGEFYRNNPSSIVISGNNQIDLTTIFSGTNGNGRWFSAGLFGGGNATSSTGTGQLNTHALIKPSYVKATGNVSIDYQIIVN